MVKIDAMQVARFTHPVDGDGSCVQCPNCADLAGQDVELPSGSVIHFTWEASPGWDVCDSCGVCLGDDVEKSLTWHSNRESYEITI